MDALRRPYAVPKKVNSPRLEFEQAHANRFHVPHRFTKPSKDEEGWKLPVEHRRHLFKLPYEVIDRIMKHCLVVDGTVTPNCVPINQFQKKQLPTYEAENEYSLWRIHKCRRRDPETNKWQNQKIKIYKKSIDATVLRVCKVSETLSTPGYGSLTDSLALS